jgi:hypothetical protein
MPQGLVRVVDIPLSPILCACSGEAVGQPILKTSLHLLYELRNQQMPLILGGGYGLYLKQVHLQEARPSATLIPGELWPSPRATEDLDILVRTEVVVDAGRMRLIRAALDRLGYAAIPGAEFMQFVKPLRGGMHVKVDLLTGPLGPFADDPRVKVDERRVRLREKVQLHAHRTDEAVGLPSAQYGAGSRRAQRRGPHVSARAPDRRVSLHSAVSQSSNSMP